MTPLRHLFQNALKAFEIVRRSFKDELIQKTFAAFHKPPGLIRERAHDTIRYHFSVTAGSRISSFPSPAARSRARTPKGSVSIGRSVWPMGAAETMGTRRGGGIGRQAARTERV